MNEPLIYQSASSVQRHDAKRILKEYATVIQWRLDGRDRLIDIGSGSGNVLMDYIHPLLPQDFEEIVGSDVSSEMVSYANKIYANTFTSTKFIVLDISSDILPDQLVEHFDHVTSFYCLHWVQNHKQALKNIFRLLRSDGGDCLLVFLATNPIFDIYEAMSKLPKWGKYMFDYKNYISPLHYSANPGAEFGQLLQETGFTHFNVEIRNEVYFYEGLQTLRNNAEAVSPFLDRIPAELHKEFFDDFVNTMVNMKLRQSTDNSDDYRIVSPYKLVVAYARKFSGILRSISEDKSNDQVEKRVN